MSKDTAVFYNKNRTAFHKVRQGTSFLWLKNDNGITFFISSRLLMTGSRVRVNTENAGITLKADCMPKNARAVSENLTDFQPFIYPFSHFHNIHFTYTWVKILFAEGFLPFESSFYKLTIGEFMLLWFFKKENQISCKAAVYNQWS